MFVSIQNGTTVIFEFIRKGNFAYGLIDWRSLPELPFSLGWRHNERDGVSNHQPHECLLNRLVRRRSKKTSKLRVTGLCEGNLPVTGEFPAQMTSNAENVSIWWRLHVGELSSLSSHSNSFEDRASDETKVFGKTPQSLVSMFSNRIYLHCWKEVFQGDMLI